MGIIFRVLPDKPKVLWAILWVTCLLLALRLPAGSGAQFWFSLIASVWLAHLMDKIREHEKG